MSFYAPKALCESVGATYKLHSRKRHFLFLSSVVDNKLFFFIMPDSDIDKVQSSAIITQSNFSRYYMRYCDDSGRTRSDFKLTTVTPYLALTGELWGDCHKDIGENWLRYNGTALYVLLSCYREW